MAVNFTKNQDEIIKAWREVVDSSDAPKWALFGYESTTNNIKLMATGSKGLDELVQEFNCSLIQYAFCRVVDKELNINKLILINWQGDSSPLSRKGLCASHVGDVSNYFKGCTQTITLRNDDEATKEYLMEQVVKTSASRINLRQQQQLAANNVVENVPSVGSTYKKADISSDLASDRKTFWQRQEEEEKQRLAEEKKRNAEKQAQFERERKLKEETETKKLAETIKKRDRLIEATRQADQSSSSGSQPSSVVNSNDTADDDSRVGRRSELIRLERNQETQSLISKGLIKNKRAIFEQAQQQQKDHQPTLVRRASGAMITQRVNTFKSLDNSNVANISSSSNSTNSNSNNEPKISKTSKVDQNLSNGFAKKLSVNGDEHSARSEAKDAEPVKKKVEPIKITNDEEKMIPSVTNNEVISPKKESTIVEEPSKPAAADNFEISPVENSDIVENGKSADLNGNCDDKKIGKEYNETEAINSTNNDDAIANGKSDIKAVALYDYQAADNTEISFDPEDVIGSILKVDPGWWHGQILSGRFKGQAGLFPANYVQEI